jgi:hypothetical protein
MLRFHLCSLNLLGSHAYPRCLMTLQTAFFLEENLISTNRSSKKCQKLPQPLKWDLTNTCKNSPVMTMQVFKRSTKRTGRDSNSESSGCIVKVKSTERLILSQSIKTRVHKTKQLSSEMVTQKLSELSLRSLCVTMSLKLTCFLKKPMKIWRGSKNNWKPNAN